MSEQNQVVQQVPPQQEQQSQEPKSDLLAQQIAKLQEQVSLLSGKLETAATASQSAGTSKQQEDVDLRSLLSSIDTTDDSDDKYERLTNRQLIDVLTTAVDAALKANAERVKNDIFKSLSLDREKLTALEQATMRVVASLGLAETRKQFPDFDSYKQDIVKILEAYPQMSYEDAYLLAKSKKAGAMPPKSQIETEKPAIFATAPSRLEQSADAFATMSARGRTETQKESSERGIVGFRGIVDAAIDRLMNG